MGTVTNSTPTFNGTSQFAGDLQVVINNAVAAATGPITAMQTQQTTLNNQYQAVSSLAGDFTSLQSAIQSIQSAVSGSSMSASVSDPTVVSATVGNGAIPGQYSILVSNAGAYSSTLTNNWAGTSSGAADSYVLAIGSQTYNVNATDNSATSVASAINSQYGSLVQATVVNVGSNASPSYRLSLQSTDLTSDVIDLTDNGTSTSAVQSAGAPVQYEVNNSGTVVSSDSRSLNVATGVTLNIVGSSDSSVDIDVTQDSSSLSNSVAGFVSAYNIVQNDLTQQRGQKAGALQGSELVNQLQQVLHNLITYSPMGNNAVNGWRDLGVTFSDSSDTDPTLTFDPNQLSIQQSSASSGLAAFLGSAPGSSYTTADASATGSGFLLAATNAMTSLTDPIDGLLTTTENDYQTEITGVTNQISDRQAKVTQMKSDLTNQMNAADAMINSLQQQYTNLSGLLQAEAIAAQQYKS